MSPLSGLQQAGFAPLFAHRQEAGERLAAAIVALNPAVPQPQRAVSATGAFPPEGSHSPGSAVSSESRNPESRDPEFSALEFSAPEFSVYALPRGGLPVAVPIARALGCPLDVIVAKKITRPDNPEFALGAVTAEGYTLWSTDCPCSQQTAELRDPALQRATAQLRQFRAYRPPQSPQGKIAIIVDDGMATGMTMAVAVAAVRDQQPAAVWIAVPVAPRDVLPRMERLGDRVVVLATPDPFHNVSRFYAAFPQVSMAEAIACLQAADSQGSSVGGNV